MTASQCRGARALGAVKSAPLIYTAGSLCPKGPRGGYGAICVHVEAVGKELVVPERRGGKLSYAAAKLSMVGLSVVDLQSCAAADS